MAVPTTGKRHQFRLMLCGHKAVEAGAVCILLMVQGHILDVTAAHLFVASKTGLLAVMPVLVVSFTRHARALVNRWTGSAILGATTFAADALVHGSHYPGAYTEAALTAAGAFLFSLVVSYTRVGHYIDSLGAGFLGAHHPNGVTEHSRIETVLPKHGPTDGADSIPE